MYRRVSCVGLLLLISCGDNSSAEGSSSDTQSATETTAGQETSTTNTTDTTDTTTDTADSAGECLDGETRPCYPGPPNTENIGTCTAGIQTCETGQWQGCEGETLPHDDEVCDDLDDDCDGVIDDACIMWHHQEEASSAVYDLALDTDGNVYVAGVFWADDFTLGGPQPLPHQGDWDVFVARFAPDGTHVWSKGMGGLEEDELRGIALDGAGNLYITGAMNGDATVEGDVLTGLGGNDLFVAKYTVDGQRVWSNVYGSTGYEIGYDVAVDAAGGPVISGNFDSMTDLGAGPVMSAGSDDVFLVRMTPDGAPIWSRTAGSADAEPEFGWAVGVFPGSGDILWGGSFRQTINLGGADLVDVFRLDMFLARYTDAGDHVWSRSYGSGADDDIYGLDIDTDGNILIAGRGSNQLDFGVTPMGGMGQAVAAKLDGDGNGIWARHSEGGFAESYATCMAVAAGPSGDVFLAGYVDGDVNFGDEPEMAVGGVDIDSFITKLDPNGGHLWSRAFGEDDTDYAWAVAAGLEGQSIYGGSLYSFEGRMFMTMFGG